MCTNLWISSLRHALFIFLCCGFAHAQSTLPASLQPGRLDKDLTPTTELRSARESIPIDLPAVGSSQPPAASATIRFLFQSIELDGNHVLSKAQLAPLWSGLAGHDISLAEIFDLAQRISTTYQQAGYLLSQAIVPAQQIRDGVVRIQVVEGWVDGVEIQGSIAQQQALDRARLSPLLAERPLRLATLERVLLLLNDLPGTIAKAYLQPSVTPGASTLIVRMEQVAGGASFSINNRGGKYLGPWRYVLVGNAHDVLVPHDRHGAQLTGTPDGRLSGIHYGTDFLLGSDGLKLTLNLASTQARPIGTSVPELALTSNHLGLVLSYPLERSRSRNLTVRSELSGSNSRSTAAGVRLNEDRPRAWRLGLTFDLTDRFGGITLIDGELSQGLRGLGASAEDSPWLTRMGSRPDFTKVTYSLARLQSLGESWSALLALSGQISPYRLYPGEQFGLGGEQILRAYDASELTGDQGMAAKIELRRTLSLPSLPATAYVFHEIGQVRNHNPLGGGSRDSAAASGIGLRSSMFEGLSAQIELAKPWLRDVASVQNRDWRLFASIVYSL